MTNEDLSFLALVVSFCISIWVLCLFFLLCRRVKQIKAVLLAGFGLKEIKTYGGIEYHRPE